MGTRVNLYLGDDVVQYLDTIGNKSDFVDRVIRFQIMPKDIKTIISTLNAVDMLHQYEMYLEKKKHARQTRPSKPTYTD